MANIHIDSDGVVRCTCGTLLSFAEDLVSKICPITETAVKCIFNDKLIFVNKEDTEVTIIKKWANTPYNNYERGLVDTIVEK